MFERGKEKNRCSAREKTFALSALTLEGVKTVFFIDLYLALKQLSVELFQRLNLK